MKHMQQHVKQYSLSLDKIILHLREDKMVRDKCNRGMLVGSDCGKFRARGNLEPSGKFLESGVHKTSPSYPIWNCDKGQSLEFSSLPRRDSSVALMLERPGPSTDPNPEPRGSVALHRKAFRT